MEEAIGECVKINRETKGTHYATRIPIVDSTPVQQIHSEVKRQVDTAHINTDERLFVLMQELYPSSCHDYIIMNHSGKIAIPILRTGMGPDLDQNEKIAYCEVIKYSIVTVYLSIFFNSLGIYWKLNIEL